MANRFNTLPDTGVDKIMEASLGWPAFLAEHPGAVNTTIGVIIDPKLDTPWQPDSVTKARAECQAQIIEDGEFKYQGQRGYAEFLTAASEHVFGRESLARQEGLMAYQTLGGTGALSLSKEILDDTLKPDGDGNLALVYDAGWPNHPVIFNTFQKRTYNHVDEVTGKYDHQAAIDAFEAAPEGAVFLLQTCGYNDDGMDRKLAQWEDILDIAEAKRATVIFDSAYMGLIEGFDRERTPILRSIERGLLTFVTFSASKNMGLYNERLGALFIANAEQNLGQAEAAKLDKLVCRIIRRTVSNPPLLVAKVASKVLTQKSYHEELVGARDRLKLNRQIFADIVRDTLPSAGRGKGLFLKVSPAGFSEKQMQVLEDSGVYALESSRINLGGVHTEDIHIVAMGVLKALSISGT